MSMLTIKPATLDELDIIRSLFKEYAEWMEYKLCFDTFQQELDQLPGQYSQPTGELLLARFNSEPAGCIAIKQIGENICEMKRLWVRDKFRSHKIGIALIKEIITVAQTQKYKKMRLETAPIMAKAIELYKSIGFKIETETQDSIVMFKSL